MSMEGDVSRESLAPAARTPLTWRALVAAALLSLALGVVLYESLVKGGSSVAPAQHLRASSRLKPAASTHGQKGLGSLPAAAQGPISQALGAGNPAYRVSA